MEQPFSYTVTILLLVAFIAMEFVSIRQIQAVIKRNVLWSGIYALLAWTIYFFGIYELIVNIHYAIPCIIGAVIGTMLAVKYKH